MLCTDNRAELFSIYFSIICNLHWLYAPILLFVFLSVGIVADGVSNMQGHVMGEKITIQKLSFDVTCEPNKKKPNTGLFPVVLFSMHTSKSL